MSRILCQLRCDAFKPKPQLEFMLNPAALCNTPNSTNFVPSRTKYWNNRHRDDRYRKERSRKLWRLELPDFDEIRRKEKSSSPRLSPDEIRARFKEKGISPPNPWNERQVFQPCTMSVIEAYKPYESDGKSSSLITKIKNPLSEGKEFVKNRRTLGAIRSYEGEEFNLDDFATQAKEVYIKAHELLSAENDPKIFDYVTEHCWPIMTAGLKKRTIIWKYLDDIEPPAVVHLRAGELISKTNQYAQITVRFHSKQIMAVFDRHGRLILGSPTDVKEVLEYIVFEKYLSNEYGEWRLHQRISLGETRPDQISTRIRVKE